MRLAAAALALLLAGCTAPADDKPVDPLFGVCPQWAQGHGGQTSGVSLTGDASERRELGPADERYLDRPLDLFRVRIERLDLDGVLELRAESADGKRLSLRDYRLGETQMVPVANLDADAVGNEFDVFLSPILHDAPSAALPAALNWTLEGASAIIDYTVTYHYKVCGA
ncbi:MAG: hypothetical protein AABY18_01315 [Candidatus Thermoplasmatota archaeon]